MFTKSLPKLRVKQCLDLIKFVEEQFPIGESSKVVDGYIDIITNLKSRWRNVENWLKIWWMKEHIHNFEPFGSTKIRTRFVKIVAWFWITSRNLYRVLLGNRGTIFSGAGLYIRLHSSCFVYGLERETWKTKEVNFRVECPCSEGLLGWETM